MPRLRVTLRLILLLAVALTVPSLARAQSAGEVNNPIATMAVEPTGVTWPPHVEYSSLVLTVSTPGGEVLRKEFQRGVNPSFNLVDKNGNKRPDGQYVYELRLIPVVSQQVRDALKASREEGNSKTVMQQLQQEGQLPTREVVQSGSFVVSQGAVVSNAAAETSNPASKSALNRTTQNMTAQEGGPGLNDSVTPDDSIIQGSLCVGLDCVNNESFGFDTARLKENNTRLTFMDTSTSNGFPTRDWRLRANENSSGGMNAFFIDDMGDSSTGAETPVVSTPFTLQAGAPTNSIFLDSTGRLGLRTATPGLDIHMNTNNTPAIRFEQNNSGGFTAQTWDVAGNEANFFVRDLTGGSKLPFRIRPGAPTSSIDIAASGNVGIGTGSPGAKLDVFSFRADGNASGLRIVDGDNVTNNIANPIASLYNSNGNGQLDLFNAAATQDVQIKAGGVSFLNGGNVGIGTSSPAFKLDVAGAVNATSYNINGVALNLSSAVSGTGATDRLVKWTDGANRVIGNSVIAESNGNVGIGTASPNPNSVLHVDKSWNNGTALFVTNNSTGSAALVTVRAGLNPNNYAVDNASLNILSPNWTPGSAGPFLKGKTVLLEGNGSNFGIGNINNTEPVIFYTTSARQERMRVNADGNVGIGTTTPQSALQVNGYVQLALTSGAPPATDCDNVAEQGRMKVDAAGDKLYVCTSTGWKSTALVP